MRMVKPQAQVRTSRLTDEKRLRIVLVHITSMAELALKVGRHAGRCFAASAKYVQRSSQVSANWLRMKRNLAVGISG